MKAGRYSLIESFIVGSNLTVLAKTRLAIPGRRLEPEGLEERAVGALPQATAIEANNNCRLCRSC